MPRDARAWLGSSGRPLTANSMMQPTKSWVATWPRRWRTGSIDLTPPTESLLGCTSRILRTHTHTEAHKDLIAWTHTYTEWHRRSERFTITLKNKSSDHLGGSPASVKSISRVRSCLTIRQQSFKNVGLQHNTSWIFTTQLFTLTESHFRVISELMKQTSEIIVFGSAFWPLPALL